MNVDVSLSDQDVRCEKFKPLNYFKLPRLFTGVIIKNRFEEKLLKPGLKEVEDIAHFAAFDGSVSPVYFRGIFVEPSAIIQRVFEQINNINNINYHGIYKIYAKILSDYNLSCNNTYSYLMDGVYPIDSIHYDSVVADVSNFYKIKRKVLDQESIPWYFNPEIKIFILSKCNTYVIQNTTK
jgi:hypothetical protein